MKTIIKILNVCTILLILGNQNLSSEEKKINEKGHEWNFYSGMFDFSDNGMRSSIIGIQHHNENLTRDSFLGTLSPITGFMMTARSSTYAYTGVQAQYKFGKLNIIPSFTPGLYGEGKGKDLGHVLEFKSEVQLSLELPKESQLGFSYNHLSNASLGKKNPGANSYMFNLLKKF